MIYDFIIILTVSIFAFVGYKRKASGTLLGLCVFAVSAVLSLWLSKFLSVWIYDNFLGTWIYNSISDKVSAFAESTAEEAAQGVLEIIPRFFLSFFSYFSLDADMLKSEMLRSAGEGISALSQFVADLLRSPVTGILHLILGILLFTLFIILFKFLSKLLIKAFELPIALTADAMLGGALGLFEGLLTVILVSSVILVCLPLAGDNLTSFTDTVFGNSLCLSFMRRVFEEYIQLFVYKLTI